MRRTQITVLSSLIAIILFTGPHLVSDTVIIPGDVNRICYYTQFFYNYPDNDFLYYLNDRLLFSEVPDGKLVTSGSRNKIRKTILWHNLVKKYVQKMTYGLGNELVFDLTKPQESAKAGVFLKLLGLSFKREGDGRFKVTPDRSSTFVDYYRFDLINPIAYQSQINKTKKIRFKLKEQKLTLPWSLDFLGEIIGQKLSEETFFEKMVTDERFSLLLGLLYRLSDQEIKYIADIIQQPRMGGWKTIYQK